MSLLFDRKRCVIATKHQKETIMAPILEANLGVQCVAPASIDTDQLGTFSGETPRNGTILEVLRAKCQLGLDACSADIAVASEGSFGPHPRIPFMAANQEYLMLQYKAIGLEVVVQTLSADTNFAAESLKSFPDLEAFCERIHFPSHALILRPAHDIFTDMHKGIQDEKTLWAAYKSIYDKYGTVYVETDMRAHLNPKRQAVIGLLTQQLVEAVLSSCPNCAQPGFQKTGVIRGLPCSWCGFPTESPLEAVWHCSACDYQENKPFQANKTTEDPMYCSHCNP
jgi:hypothetical protein